MPDAARHPPPHDVSDLRALLQKRLERDMADLRNAVRAIGFSQGLRSQTELDDLLGEIVKQVLEKAHNYDPARSAVAWAVGFVRHILLQRLERQGRLRREVNASDLAAASDTELFDKLQHATESPADHPEVHVWLERLNEPDRELLRRRYFDGLTTAELAVALTISPEAVRTRLVRATRRLRQIAQAEGGHR
jgi:RNA polymerase sigma-70 factor (ECF subfamily)